MRNAIRPYGTALLILITVGLLCPIASWAQGQDDAQKRLDDLRKEMTDMQGKMSQLRQKLTELSRSGASAEEIQKALDEMNKEFGFRSGKKESNEDERMDKSAKETPPSKGDTGVPQPRVWMGFTGEEGDQGVLVESVTPGSPSAKAGIKNGDIVTKFNNEPVVTGRDIVEKEVPFKPGDKITLTVLRDEQEQTIEVILEKRPDGPIEVPGDGRMDEEEKGKGKEQEQPEAEKSNVPAVWLGFNGEETEEGFEVTKFNTNSPVKKAGLRKGDIVTKFNGEEVSTAVEIVEKEMPLRPGDKITLTILRDNQEMSIEIVAQQRPSDPPEYEEEEDEKDGGMEEKD